MAREASVVHARVTALERLRATTVFVLRSSTREATNIEGSITHRTRGREEILAYGRATGEGLLRFRSWARNHGLAI